MEYTCLHMTCDKAAEFGVVFEDGTGSFVCGLHAGLIIHDPDVVETHKLSELEE